MKKGLLLSIFSLLLLGALSAQITTVAIIGTATPNDWNDPDTDMVQDPDSAHLWTLTLELKDGEMKFRANDNWDVNWGETSFPMGTGEQGGDNIPVIGGNYLIEFNSNTGEYYLENIDSPIGILGSAAPFSWDRDVNLIPDTAGNASSFFITMDLGQGDVKFRQDDGWDVNWGSTDFPMGIGTQGGDNIPIDKAGNYFITFDTATGAYNFTENVSFFSVGMIGPATEYGWDSATAMTQNEADPDIWTFTGTLLDGGLQFVGNDGEIVWGGSDFPDGTAEVDGDTINVVGNRYKVELNTKTGAYSFQELVIYESIGIIGDARLSGAWDPPDTDMARSPADSSEWTLRVELGDGELKFRANDDWSTAWGSSDFPTGVGQTGFSPNIPITAGEYIINFNSFSGAYDFKELIIYDTMGLIGTATPFGNWDDDVIMDRHPDDENRWIIPEVAISDHNGASDGGVKFRADKGWTNNWGAADWPSGVGTQDGDNIVTVGGVYGIMFNDATGEYAFGDPITSSVEDLLDPADIKAYPNPAQEILNLDLSAVPFEGNIQLEIYDMAGNRLIATERNAQDQIQISIRSLPIGQYAMQIRNEKYIVGKRFAVIRP